MSTPLANYSAVEPDAGDANPTASSQVAGGSNSVSKALDTHDHTAGKGLSVPFSALVGDATLDVGGQPVVKIAYLSIQPMAAGVVPNSSLFVDTADGRIKFRDGTGTVRTLTWTP